MNHFKGLKENDVVVFLKNHESVGIGDMGIFKKSGSFILPCNDIKYKRRYFYQVFINNESFIDIWTNNIKTEIEKIGVL